jgi:hypothetical protein
LARPRHFSADEVQHRLRLADPHDPRTHAVQAAASQTAIWSGLLPERTARDLGPAATRLPTAVFWYRRGLELEEIGRRLSPFGGAWDGQRAVHVACELIAHLLNRGRLGASTV